MKTVYFVRHGATANNIKQEYQAPDAPLSDVGFDQARRLADRSRKLPIEVVLTSTMTRARQTAQIIAQACDVPLVDVDFFHEIRRPAEVHGRSKTDPEVEKIIEFTRQHFNDGERFSDEENFPDLRKRALRMLEYIANRAEDKILAVVHGTILIVLLSVMMRGETTESDFFESIESHVRTSNTGITKCEYKDGAWKLVIWNDHAHLG